MARADVPQWLWRAIINNFNLTQDDLAAQQAQIDALMQSNADLQTQVVANAAYIQQLQSYIEITEGDIPQVIVNGANLVVRNGLGTTDTINGSGNLVIGYAEPNIDGAYPYFCSDGEYLEASICISAGESWEQSLQSGSHNLVMGKENNYSRYGQIVSGKRNTANGDHAMVHGESNFATGDYSFVGAGQWNNSVADYAGISGGRYNIASGDYSSIVGGWFNDVIGSYAVVAGGDHNNATGESAVVSGGYNNTAAGEDAVVSGGLDRNAAGQSDWTAGTLFETE
ncbi:MAG: hypothetical protein ACR2P6_00765 [Gammaproteobacteria bacterium]